MSTPTPPTPSLVDRLRARAAAAQAALGASSLHDDLTAAIMELDCLASALTRAQADHARERAARLILHNGMTTLRDHLSLAAGDADFAAASEAQADATIAKAEAHLAEGLTPNPAAPPTGHATTGDATGVPA